MKIIFISLVILALFLFFGCTENTQPDGVACTMDAKICLDGSAVGRVAPDCNFAPCPSEDNNKDDFEPVQIANPASVYCSDNNGTLEIINTNNGQVGMCTLPSGNVCEEWAYFKGECE